MTLKEKAWKEHLTITAEEESQECLSSEECFSTGWGAAMSEVHGEAHRLMDAFLSTDAPLPVLLENLNIQTCILCDKLGFVRRELMK